MPKSKEDVLKQVREYYWRNRERILKKKRDEYALSVLNNPRKSRTKALDEHTKTERAREAERKYYRANKEKRNAKSKKYYQKNKDKFKGWSLINKRKARKDPIYRLNRAISGNIRHSLKNKKNGYKWELLVGYTSKELKKHLEKQFTGGMSWDNYGKWHIDHKVPTKVFNFSKSEHLDFKRCWALNNLQPLWAEDNMSKKDKLDKPFQPYLAF